ncbi:unnamed protein product [Amoebophrya sp. A25]|nr:unnamed protein product [Amoebophrya sp. A25]|eukprot:GSA25T00009689001.1
MQKNLRYALGDELGRGQFTRVVKAVSRKPAAGEDEEATTVFAAKVYDRSAAAEIQIPYWGPNGIFLPDFSLNDRAEKEVEIFKRLQQVQVHQGGQLPGRQQQLHSHPNIVKFISVVENPSTFWHVFEYVPDGILMEEYGPQGSRWQVARKAILSLDVEAVEGQGRENKSSPLVFSPTAALRNFEQLQSGLAFLHSRGVIHKDIAPRNILVSGQYVRGRDMAQPENDQGGSSKSLNGTGKVDAATAGLGGVSRGNSTSSTSCCSVATAPPQSRTATSASSSPSSFPVLKICDFNNSELLPQLQNSSESSSEEDSTCTSKIYSAEGTMCFRPPEAFGFRVRETGICGRQRDLWSLGAVTFVMCFGCLPFGLSDISSTAGLQMRLLSMMVSSRSKKHCGRKRKSVIIIKFLKKKKSMIMITDFLFITGAKKNTSAQHSPPPCSGGYMSDDEPELVSSDDEQAGDQSCGGGGSSANTSNDPGVPSTWSSSIEGGENKGEEQSARSTLTDMMRILLHPDPNKRTVSSTTTL